MNNKSNKTPKFIFEDKLNGREKELTPMLLKTIEYKEKKHVALSKAVDKVLVNYPGVHSRPTMSVAFRFRPRSSRSRSWLVSL